MKHLHRSVLLGLLLMLVLGQACRAESEARPSPQRLAITGQQLAEIVFALGAGDRVAAIRGYVDHIPGGEDTARIRDGGPVVRSAEAVLAHRPDEVWVMEGRATEQVLAQIAAAGVPHRLFPSEWTPEVAMQQIQRIGQLLDLEIEAAALQARLRGELALIDSLQPLPDQPSAIFILAGGNRPMLVNGRDATFAELIHRAGGRNASQHEGYRLLSAEEMLRIAPQFIFVLDEAIDAQGQAIVLDLPGLRQTPAGRNGRIRTIEGHCLTDFGINTPVCVGRLRETLETAAR